MYAVFQFFHWVIFLVLSTFLSHPWSLVIIIYKLPVVISAYSDVIFRKFCYNFVLFSGNSALHKRIGKHLLSGNFKIISFLYWIPSLSIFIVICHYRAGWLPRATACTLTFQSILSLTGFPGYYCIMYQLMFPPGEGEKLYFTLNIILVNRAVASLSLTVPGGQELHQGLSIYRDGTLRTNSWAILSVAILNNYEISREHVAANLTNYENTWLNLHPYLHPNEMITDPL